MDDESGAAPVDKQTEPALEEKYYINATEFGKVDACLFLIKEDNSWIKLVCPVLQEQFS